MLIVGNLWRKTLSFSFVVAFKMFDEIKVQTVSLSEVAS